MGSEERIAGYFNLGGIILLQRHFSEPTAIVFIKRHLKRIIPDLGHAGRNGNLPQLSILEQLSTHKLQASRKVCFYKTGAILESTILDIVHTGRNGNGMQVHTLFECAPSYPL